MRSLPLRSTQTSPELSSCRRCLVTVGQVQEKRSAISLEVICPERMRKTTRMCRRVSCASARSTRSRSSSLRLALLVDIDFLDNRELHRRMAASTFAGTPSADGRPTFAQHPHRLPDRRDLRKLMRVRGTVCFEPAQKLDEERGPIALGSAVDERWGVRDELERAQRRPMPSEKILESVLFARLDSVNATSQ